MLSLAVVSVAAYITATLLKSEPIYESLLERILQDRAAQRRKALFPADRRCSASLLSWAALLWKDGK